MTPVSHSGNDAFASMDAFAAACADLPAQDAASTIAARARQNRLTKPEGSLGRLETLAIWYAGWRGNDRPEAPVCQVAIFAGNHGVTARQVSPYPAEVTAQMVANFNAGGAAANQLAALQGARFSVTPVALDRPTQDFVDAPAMETSELLEAMRLGAEAVEPDVDVLVLGEMGIGNTSAASALCALVFGGDARAWTGAGAGLDPDGFERKAVVVANGVNRHGPELDGADPLRPLEALRRVGGREMAAMLGAMLAARRQRTVVVLDGFIVSAVAAVAAGLSPLALEHCVAGHCSAESAHSRLLLKLGLRPLLDLGMRLGEGSGALVALGVLRAAIACHSGMATFEEAGVSDKDA